MITHSFIQLLFIEFNEFSLSDERVFFELLFIDYLVEM